MTVRALSSMLLVAGLASGCQTWGRSVSREMPADLAPLFQRCSPGDGGAIVRIFDAGALQASTELDWISRKPETFAIQLTSPIGQTLMTMRRDGADLSLAGPMARRMPEVRLGQDEFLEVDGHFVGLRASEVPCLLRAALPPEWGVRLDWVDSREASTLLHFDEPRREILVTAEKDRRHGGGYGRYCVEVSWSTFLFFSRSLTWCTEDVGDARQGVLSGLGDFSLEWTRIDDQAL